jgi:hypothetical protein
MMSARTSLLAATVLVCSTLGTASAQTVDITSYAWQFPVVTGANAPDMATRLQEAPAKPWVWGEVGVGVDGTQGNTGEAGSRFLHNIVWAGLFTPLGTTPLEWWWYQEDSVATTAKFAARKAAAACCWRADD